MSQLTNELVGRLLLVTATLVAVAITPQVVWAGTPVFVGTKASKSVSIDSVDHSTWDQLLQKYVDEDGRVDYAAWQANRADAKQLDGYLAKLSAASARVASSRECRLAFWINAYNAVTIKGILREYPTTSIRNHTAKLFGYNIWYDLQLYVGGVPFSLTQIEHEILRKMQEPRIHFAIVCASISCPRLLNRAYTADEIGNQLELNAKDFFARSQNFRHDVRGRRFHLSAIIDWFEEDFGDSQADRLRKISRWLPTEQSRRAAVAGNVSVDFLDYDWNLNRQ